MEFPQKISNSTQDQNNFLFFRELSLLIGEVVDVTNTGVAADTEFSVVHGLGRVPSEVRLMVKQGQTDAYLSIRPGPTAWTNTRIYLDCSSANANLRLKVT